MSKQIQVGSVAVGGGAPVSIQSMCNTPTRDVEATVGQILRLEEAGWEIRRHIHIPLVCDIHFDYKLALMCAEQGADKIRINPGNIGSKDRVRAVADACKERGIPIRIGVNGGSLEKELLAKHGGVTAQALVESALGHVHLLNDCNFDNICISVKCSNVPVNMRAYQLLRAQTDYPLHLGVTEAGTPTMGIEVRHGYRGPSVPGHRRHRAGEPHGRPGGGGARGETNSLCRRGAALRAESGLLSHLRADAVQHDPHCPGGGAAAGELR